MSQKGCLKIGGDADIVVIESSQVIDKAIFVNPAQYSSGFRFVMVEVRQPEYRLRVRLCFGFPIPPFL